MTTGTALEADGAAKPARGVRPDAGQARVEWVDHAKGICIVAVVMMYATHHVQQILQSQGWMAWVVLFAQPFRMPDFFLISGLFVSRVLDRPIHRYIDTKVLYFVYFYAVWVSFRFAYTDLRASYDRGALLSDYLQLYLVPPSGPLWFIYLLAVFFMVVRLVRSWPPALVLPFAAALQIADLRSGVILADKFAHYFVFFYGGYLFADRIFRAAHALRHRPGPGMLLLAVWCVLNGWAVFSGAYRLPAISLLLGLAGAMAVMTVATLCARAPWMAWLAWLGRHSIVVYLGFVMPLGVMRMFIHRSAGFIDPGTAALAVTAASIGGAVLLYLGVRRTPLRFLFARPAWTHLAPTRLERAAD